MWAILINLSLNLSHNDFCLKNLNPEDLSINSLALRAHLIKLSILTALGILEEIVLHALLDGQIDNTTIDLNRNHQEKDDQIASLLSKNFIIFNIVKARN